MGHLIKIRDVSSKYDITARTLRYYEDMGLISSTRSDDYAYRMYDEEAVNRLEQILILRKLNISIKDIQRVFSTSKSDVVLEVLGKKVERIDDEVSLLHELKEIVLEFIHEIEQVNFTDNSDIKQLYNKAKDLETQLTSREYIGKPSNINRLMNVADQLDKKIPDIMVVMLPKFKAASCGTQSWEDLFKPGGYMFQLWQYVELYEPVIFDCFDFIQSKENKGEWLCAVKSHVTSEDIGSFELIEHPGGMYAMTVSIDDDYESLKKVEEKVGKWIENTNFEFDRSRDVMFNMPYLYEEGRDPNLEAIEIGLGYKQAQRYFPIRLKKSQNYRKDKNMNDYNKGMACMEERFGKDQDKVVALATISLSHKCQPSVRLVNSYYEDGVIYISSDAKKNKTLEIQENERVSLCDMFGNTLCGKAENLGWVKDEKNKKIRQNFKRIFKWFDKEGDEDNPNSIVIRVTLSEAVLLNEDSRYDLDFVHQTMTIK